MRTCSITVDKTSWIPPQLIDSNEIPSHRFRFTKAERQIFRKRTRIPVSDWAEKFRVVTRGPLEGTFYRKETVPYSVGIMDASFEPGVEEVVICAADQVAKSFIIDTCLGYGEDMLPGPALVVYPDENTATENMTDRIIPMFKKSSRLRSYITGNRDDETGKKLNLTHTQIYTGWARSPIQLANRSIKYLALDEIDKYPLTAGTREADPISKAEKRVRTYKHGRKKWKSSTPTIEMGPIWVELNSCQVVFEYQVSCPDCGARQVMTFEQIKWPEKERDPVKVQNKDLAHYVCPHCGSCWSDLKRDAAVRWGRWVAMAKTPDGQREIEGAGMELFEYLKKYRPKKIGFHIPAWLSTFVSISEIAAAFLKSLNNKTLLKDFRNSYEALPWTDWTQERQEDVILKLRDDRPDGVVPGGGIVQCLNAGVDTHGLDERGWFRFEIRAWGWGNEGMTLPRSWQVRAGYAESFNVLEEILWGTKYYDAEGKEYFIPLTLQDAMGRRTNEVYSFCLKHRNKIFPAQGVDSTRMSTPHSFTNLEYFAGPKGHRMAIPGGLRLYRFSNLYYKNILAGKLEIGREDPGAWLLHSETGEDWARELCSETIDPKTMQWVRIGSMPNHGWDCSVLCILAAELQGLKYRRQPERKRPEGGGQRADNKGVVKSKFMSRG